MPATSALALLSLLLSTNVGLASGEVGCFSNLVDLSQAINDKATFTVETYILCPDTVFNVGFLNSDNGYDGGDPAIPMRANSKILCGEDGSSANNCVLRGGGYQVIATINLFVGEDPINVLVSGLTFDSPQGNGLLLVSPGDITFNDCIFRVSRDGLLEPSNLTSILQNSEGNAARLIYFGHDTEEEDDERRLAEAPLARLADFMSNPQAQKDNIERIKRESQRNRLLQKGDITTLEVSFDSCRFEKNKYGGENGLSVIEIATPHVRASITNSIFYKNDYATDAVGPSFIIFSAQEGSNLNMESNCFIHNEVAGSSLISFVDEPLGPFQNNFGTKINGLKCPFIAGGSNTCIEFDADACPLPFEYEELPTSSSPGRFPVLVRSVMLVFAAMMGTMLWQ